MVHNKNKSYLFIGEFTDPKLTKAKGMKLHLSEKVMSGSEEIELVEDG
jgi:hypothetical protein